MKQQSFRVTHADHGRTLAAFLKHRCGARWGDVRQAISVGAVMLNGQACRKSGQKLRAGDNLKWINSRVNERLASARKQDPAPIVRYRDAHIVVVDKPAGLTTVRHAREFNEHDKRARRYLPPTLADLLPGLLAKENKERMSRVFAVHRLDKDTSGLVVFARTKDAERHLGKQMRGKSVGRRYLALVRGQAVSQRIETWIVRDRGDGRRGSREDKSGKHAVTNVRLLKQHGDFSLVECELETGRTHQIRIHLGERGTPLCGERIYDRPLHGRPLPDGSGATRPLLHATFLEIEHPGNGKRVSWTSPRPDDMKAVLQKPRSE